MNIIIFDKDTNTYKHLRQLIKKWNSDKQNELRIYRFHKLVYDIRLFSSCDIIFLDENIEDFFDFYIYLKKYDEKIKIIILKEKKSLYENKDIYSKPLKQNQISTLLDQISFRQSKNCLIYQKNWAYKKIKYHHIIYIQIKTHSLYIHTMNKTECIRSSLKEIIKLLDDRFIQCYRSVIVNIDYIRIIDKDHLILFDQTKIPVSKKYKNDIVEATMKQKRNKDETSKDKK